MSTMRIDRLLDTVIKQEASDLHLTVGKPPTVRMSGRLIELKTKSLEPEDTVGLMKAISPERSQNELQEEGGSDFGFAYGPQDDPENSARFRVSIFRQKGNVALVLRRIPNKLLDIDKIGLPRGRRIRSLTMGGRPILSMSSSWLGMRRRTSATLPFCRKIETRKRAEFSGSS
ncbi:MAG: hypothetical protein AAGH92_12620, partial [Planctomycetota bacterium]